VPIALAVVVLGLAPNVVLRPIHPDIQLLRQPLPSSPQQPRILGSVGNQVDPGSGASAPAASVEPAVLQPQL